MENIETKEESKSKWFDSSWATFFISIIISKLIQAIWMSDIGLVILLPITWLLVHFFFGKLIIKYSNQDIFGRDKK